MPKIKVIGKGKKGDSEPFMFYPELSDKNFFKNIYVKKEFYKNKIPKETASPEELCNPSEFILLPHQEFLRNFISQDTPYNSILIFHGTGFGKTCSAISIAEGFKDLLTELNSRVLVILGAKIRQNFKKKIYDLEKDYYKKKPDDIVQCTGNTYTVTQQGLTYKQKLRKVNNDINAYYDFFGPEQLANYVMKKITNWDGNPASLTPQNIKAISKEFSNRIIIIDEVHNIKTSEAERSKDIFKKKSPTIIETIIRYANNVRLILMSATPMFDVPREIIYIVNLLLLNDKRAPIDETVVFDKHDNMTEEGVLILQDAVRGYVSYLVGKNPNVFPIRIIPVDAKTPKVKFDISGKALPEDQQMTLSKLISLPMGKIQVQSYRNYIASVDKSKRFGSDQTLSNISNFVFPNEEGRGVTAREAFRSHDDGKGAFVKVFKSYKDIKTGKINKAMYFKYQKHAIFNPGTAKEKPFLDIHHVANFSAKLEYMLKEIRHSSGIIYIYSQWINSGVIPIALALEQNGYQRHTFPGEVPLLDYSPNAAGGGGKSRGICYYCGGDIKDQIHNPKSKDFDHNFGLAKYILLAGSTEISNIDPTDAAEYVNKVSNKYGADIKIVIGTRVSGEGIDFARIRQVWIVEPWFNYSRIEQVEGRAIRNCSHVDLPKTDRNVEIFHLVSIFPEKEKQMYETIDLKNYRIAENKYIKIKRVEDVIRKNAVDCALNKNGNYNVVNEVFQIHAASGGRFKYDMKKELNTNPRVYHMDPIVNYECVWQPGDKNIKINTDTYNIRFAKSDIQSVIKHIKLLFHYNIIFDMPTILNFVRRYNPDIETIFVYKALDIILNDPNEYIFDKYNRKGRLIYRGNYYIFQPLELNNTRIPIYYRSQPLTFKNRNIVLEDIIGEMTNTANASSTEASAINKKALDTVIYEYNTYLQLLNDVIVDNGIKIDENVHNVLVAIILDRLSMKELLNVVYNTMELYFKDQSSFKKHKVAPYIFNYLKEKDILLVKTKTLVDPKVDKYKTNDVIGFMLDDKYYCHLDICDNVLQQKIAYIRELTIKKVPKPIYNPIVGYYENDGSKKNQFKIITDATKKKMSGRACGTYKVETLIEIMKDIGSPKKPAKLKREKICVELEFLLRYFNEIKKSGKTWFISNRKV